MSSINLSHLFKSLDPEEFNFRFSSPDHCLEVIASEKWREGYVCRKCGHTNYCSGKTPFSRRCTRCKTDESATAHTIFHRCRIPITDAFEIAYMVCGTPKISSYELSRRLETRQMTCWKFKKRIMECIEEGRGLQLFEPEIRKNTKAEASIS
ncbi:MAG: transposase [Lentimicrobium sp.]|nr:transposase [Lentimicrobium sp.]